MCRCSWSERQVTDYGCVQWISNRRFLSVLVIYKSKIARCHFRFQFADNWHVTHSHSHWFTEVTMYDYVEIITHYVVSQQDMRNKSCPALVIMDNFKGQVYNRNISYP